MTGIRAEVKPFNHNRDGEDFRGHRGVVIDASTGFTGSFAFSSTFPTIFVSDVVDVSIDEYRLPAQETLQWLEAAAAAIREQLEKSDAETRSEAVAS